MYLFHEYVELKDIRCATVLGASKFVFLVEYRCVQAF